MEAIYYEWSTSSWGTSPPRAADGKQRMNANASELKRTPIKGPPTVSGVHARNARQHSNPPVQFEKRTHTNDTRESLPARQNYLGLSISVSRTIEISSHSLFAAPYMFVSIAFDSFMTVDLNEFEMCVFFPLVSISISFREAVWWHRDALFCIFIRIHLSIDRGIYDRIMTLECCYDQLTN